MELWMYMKIIIPLLLQEINIVSTNILEPLKVYSFKGFSFKMKYFKVLKVKMLIFCIKYSSKKYENEEKLEK
ncbi:hypothetical protein UJ101_00942 [Flavobacteriaceae bacterium UJ101]|nr:hypothetical protein UJ101_00942 [Flavobacteriaceae bacterium UJ101]